VSFGNRVPEWIQQCQIDSLFALLDGLEHVKRVQAQRRALGSAYGESTNILNVDSNRARSSTSQLQSVPRRNRATRARHLQP
jgi:hypothetical protein